MFYGCRHKAEDYMYQEELEKYEADGVIKVRNFSPEVTNFIVLLKFISSASHSFSTPPSCSDLEWQMPGWYVVGHVLNYHAFIAMACIS